VAAVAPLLVFLYDRTFVAGSFREAWHRRRWLHLALAATWVPLAVLVASTGWNRGGTAGFNVGVSPWAYWGTQFEAVVRYLKLAVWPHPQAFEYGTFWMGLRDSAPYALVVLPLVALTIWAICKKPRSGFLGAWFFGILAPTSVVPGTIQMIVEHRMYLPLAAVIALVVVGLHRLTETAKGQGSKGPRDQKVKARDPGIGPQTVVGRNPTPSSVGPLVAGSLRPLVPLLALALGAGALTEQRNRVYQSDLSIWEDTVAKRPESSLAQSGLGTALFLRGHEREALFHYEIALHLNRNTPTLHYNLGLALLKLNRRPEAEAQFVEACRLNPRYYSAHYELGLTRLQMGQPEAAAAQFAEAVRLMPAMTEAHYEWGVALAQMGRWTEAVDQYQAALRLDPGLVAAECDLGVALYQLGRVPEAAACFQRALRRDPNLPEAHFNLGLALARTGSTEQAIAQYAAAVRLKPAYAAAQFNLGLALAQAGRLAEAIDHLQRLVELEPASAEAHCNLGVALSKAGRPGEAVAEYEAALRLRPDYAAAHYTLGNALLALRRNAEARQQLAEALRLDPQLEAARQVLDRLRAASDAP
jgi:tetratricopeptide (TPR) repeat protein